MSSNVIFISAADQLDYLQRAYELDILVAIEVLSLCILTKFDAINSNGREWIHGEANPQRFYLSGEELLIDNVHNLYNGTPLTDTRVRAALHTYAQLPSEWFYFDMCPNVHLYTDIDVRYNGDVKVRIVQ